MKTKRIYKVGMANYLTERGFRIIQVVQDITNIQHLNWIFEDTPELREAITEYTKALPPRKERVGG